MNQKYHVKLSEAERVRIQEEKEATGTPKSIQRRCIVLLMADENAGSIASQKEIGKRCGVSGTTVSELIRQYDTQGLDYCLRRRQHEKPPRPSIITGEKEARIIALACSEAPEGYSRWTVRLLQNKVVELQIMDSVSRETIRRVLKKRNSSHI